MITTREFAELIGRPYSTVVSWLRAGLVPGAKTFQETSGTVYRVPRSAVEAFKGGGPRRGRPPKGKI
ncbi:MAG: helix-turn-helix domain-containing protein [Blastocatellia bacterium]